MPTTSDFNDSICDSIYNYLMIMKEQIQDNYEWVMHADNLKSRPLSSHKIDMSMIPQYVKYVVCMPKYRRADWMNHSTKLVYIRAAFELQQAIMTWRKQEHSCNGKYYVLSSITKGI